MTHGFTAEPRVSAADGSLALPESASASRLAWLAGGLARPGAYAIALRSDRLPDAPIRSLEMLRAAALSSQLGIYASGLPPLAIRVFGALVDALSDHVPEPGRLFALLPRLERQLVAFAWVDGVARLKSPAPTRAQSAASLLPGSSFGISISPEAGVRRLSSGDRFPEPIELEGAWEAVVAGRAANPAWVSDSVEPALGGVVVRDEEAADGDPSGWWGTAKVVEVVAYPTDVPALAERLSRGLRASPCGWCGESMAGKRCPFCHQPRVRRRNPAAAVAA